MAKGKLPEGPPLKGDRQYHRPSVFFPFNTYLLGFPAGNVPVSAGLS
jgi:hypothetical protein